MNMKFVTFCCSLLLFSSLVLSQKEGIECKSRMCLEKRGFISFHSGQTLNKIWTITNGQAFTTIVLHLKNIDIPSDLTTPWMRIYVQRRDSVKKLEIRNNTEMVFSFKDANEAIVEVSSNVQVEFKLIYYLGCIIMEGSEMTIKKEQHQLLRYMNYFSKFPIFKPTSMCWFVFPITDRQIFYKRLQNQFLSRGLTWQLTQEIEVKKLYLTFKDAWVPVLPNDTSITVSDKLTDEPIMQVGNYESLMVSSIDQSTRRVLYSEEEYLLPNMIFVDLQCTNADACRQSKFVLDSYGLQERDLQCVEKETKCLFNIGENNYNCEPAESNPISAIQQARSEALVTTSCPAFNYLSRNIMDEVIYMNNGFVVPRSSAGANRAQCTKSYKQFCKKKCNKKAFKAQGCDKLCFFIKKVLGLCRHTSYF